MKKSWIIIAVIAILGIIIYSSIKSTYNGMVTMSEEVDAKWSQVTTDYQRRMDLIPNLVNTVKGYAEFEQETLTAVVEARSKATSVTIDPSNLNAGAFAQFQQAQNGVSSALGRLLVTIEKYPDLKANQNFLELQAQLEGTENRIANARRKFNEATKTYNVYIKKFPKNIYANIFGFEQKPYFEAQQGAETAPNVEF
ncbi:MAG: LemA family protein [Bacteroidetes bacterium]|nr:LemA family protein [Bacteroidota bacterium]